MTVRGIDISKYNQVTDWRKVKASGVEFVYIRVLDDDGLTIDPFFALHWKQAKEVGLLRGAYVPFYAWNDPIQVANKVFDALIMQEAGDWWAGELPIAIDVEPSQVYKSVEYQWHQLTTLIAKIESLCLVHPIIYTGQPTWDSFVNPNRDITFETLPDLWHAGYIWAMPHETTFAAWQDSFRPYKLPNNWTDWKIWQWAGDDGRVDGIESACDLDVFNGTFAELVAWGEAHKIAETDNTPDIAVGTDLPFDSRDMDLGVHELDIFGRFAAWWKERFTPKPKITNQQVINAFYSVYGGKEYWDRLISALGEVQANGLAANRDALFVDLEKLPEAVNTELAKLS